MGWVLLSATGLATSTFGACVVVLTAAGRSTHFGASAGFAASTALSASTALDCWAAAGSSFDASVRPRPTPACAVADARANAAIRMNLRMLSLPLLRVARRLGQSKRGL